MYDGASRNLVPRWAIAAGVPFKWFTADELYGQNPGLRTWLENEDVFYVMATRCDDEIPSGLFTTTRIDALVGKVRAGAWIRRPLVAEGNRQHSGGSRLA